MQNMQNTWWTGGMGRTQTASDISLKRVDCLSVIVKYNLLRSRLSIFSKEIQIGMSAVTIYIGM